MSRLIVSALILGCASAAQPRPAPCDLNGVSELTDYGAVEDGQRYWIDVVREGSEWRPAQTPRMPMHHASRIELSRTDHPELIDRTAARIVLTLVSREIRPVAERRWRATYFANVERVCSASSQAR